MSRHPVFCPVIYGLVQRAPTLTLMRFPGWAKAISRASLDIALNLKK